MKDSIKKMLGLRELKGKIEITPTMVECPVKGCKLRVKKMSRGDPNLLDAYLEKGQAIKAMTSLKDYFCKELVVWGRTKVTI